MTGSAPTLDVAARIVQLALTPIFLLTGLASLLNVFAARLGRVADRVDLLAAEPERHARQLLVLRRRSKLLDLAVLSTSLAGALTCCAALSLFVGALNRAPTGQLLLALFGAAVTCAVVALGVFAFETILSSRAVREVAVGAAAVPLVPAGDGSQQHAHR